MHTERSNTKIKSILPFFGFGAAGFFPSVFLAGFSSAAGLLDAAVEFPHDPNLADRGLSNSKLSESLSESTAKNC